MNGLAFRPSPALSDGSRVYLVLRDGVPVGHVVTVEVASHVRRGRAQASPWWRAVCFRHGHHVPQDEQIAAHVPDPRGGRWTTRARAAAALAAHVDLHREAAILATATGRP